MRCRGKGQGTRSKKRNAAAFEQARLEIESLKRAAQAGQIEVAYLDEAGFSCIHPNRNAWTPTGRQHLIPAIRGQRLNVLAALMSSGYLEDCMFYGSMTGERLVKFIKEVAGKYEKPITFILDNASFHTSAVVRQAKEEFEKLGVTLKFLPPYSPELNRIEKLWHTVKHHWMDVKCRTSKILEAELADIFQKFGSGYKFEFYG